MLFLPENCLWKKFYEHEAFLLFLNSFTTAAKVFPNTTPEGDIKIERNNFL